MTSNPSHKVPVSRVLCMVRQQEEFFRYVCPRVFEGDILYLNEYRAGAGLNLMERFYRLWRRGGGKSLPAERVEDIIRRDRVLRTLPRAKAARMVGAMALALDHILDETQPALFIAKPVDNYIADLMYEELERRDIARFGMGAHVLNGYSRAHIRGEYVRTRETDDREIEAAVSQLATDNFRPNFAIYKDLSLGVHLDKWARLNLKRAGYALKRLAERDYLNFEYLSVGPRIIRRTLMSYSGIHYFSRDWKARAARSGKPVVYLPLHCWPEITVDYWLSNYEFADYETGVARMVEALSKRFFVLVKEHPWEAGGRPVEFYQALIEWGATLIPAFTHSGEVVNASDYALVANSTVGIEAALRGKRVITLERPSYFVPELFHAVDTMEDVDALTPEILEARPLPPLDEARRMLMKHILEGCFEGDFLTLDYMKPENLEIVARSLRRFINSPLFPWGKVS